MHGVLYVNFSIAWLACHKSLLWSIRSLFHRCDASHAFWSSSTWMMRIARTGGSHNKQNLKIQPK